MIGHLGLNVPDLDHARRYYAALMPALDFEAFLDDADQFAFRPARGKPGTYLFFYPSTADALAPYSAEATGLQHLAFMVPTRSRVHEARDLALSLGSEIVHEPKEWPQYPPPYYATFWHDPFGFMLEAVCHHDRA
jgi:catechol 2,3-dioxygenase-like lactoylglutathione lyase family enzyme